ncbi:carboxy-S-adenosyl-L-methionine synthase CmoA [Candidatus Leptofilum sp.]|uniref:carboxy-S-adenosyl-L-methionine synthase CmoA n=1 Tax=Candidatus Leptofilum sp. TaxID=3241576 RepID=UPI003B5CB834
MAQDNIYATEQTQVAPFSFDEEVVAVFPDMIERSVPGYTLLLPLIGQIASRYAQPHSRCYDLGCSLGAVMLALRQQIKQEGCRITAVDNAPAMIEKCRKILAQTGGTVPVDLVEADISEVPIEQASVVVLNFTLQFLPPAQRDTLIQRIYDGLLPGGVLILSEKVIFEPVELDNLLVRLHHDFKRANGYSELEISQKRTALENVLISETIPQHQKRLRQAGFASVDVWFQAFNFVSLLAKK